MNMSTAEPDHILAIQEDVVAARCAELRGNLRQIIADGARHLTLDFTQVRMVDSAGIGLLIATHNSLRRVEGELALVNCSLEILELFQTMRLHQHMRVEGEGASL